MNQRISLVPSTVKGMIHELNQILDRDNRFIDYKVILSLQRIKGILEDSARKLDQENQEVNVK